MRSMCDVCDVYDICGDAEHGYNQYTAGIYSQSTQMNTVNVHTLCSAICSAVHHPSTVQSVAEIYGVDLCKGRRLPLVQVEMGSWSILEHSGSL